MSRLIPVLALVVLCLAALPAAAQDGSCDVDLTNAAGLLMGAQRAAAAGDAELAVTQMEMARALLGEAIARCGGEPGTAVEVPPPDDALPLIEGDTLTETHTLRLPEGDLTFQYPAGWFVDSLTEDSVLVVNQEALLAMDLAGQDPPAIESGELALLIGRADLAEASGEPIDAVNALYADVPSSWRVLRAPATLSLGVGGPAADLLLANDATQFAYVVVATGATAEDSVLVAVVVLAPPETEPMRTLETARAVAATLALEPAD